MPELDAIRGVAVSFVMIAHFVPDEAVYHLPLATTGVQQFFVLSGFLITGILLRARATIEAGHQPASAAILKFYARRFIRLMPIFYLTLGLAWLAGLPEVRDSISWHLSYFTNVYFARTQDWHGRVSHLWSLAVEEQFYLIWPFVVVFTPRRYLLAALVGIASVGPTFRTAGTLMGLDWMVLYTLPFGWLDSLAIGGVLAYAVDSVFGRARIRRLLSSVGLWVGLPVVLISCLTIALQVDRPVWFRAAIEPSLWAFFFVWVIDLTLRHAGGASARVLRFRPLVYLGTISYGLYLLHVFAPGLVDALAAGLSVPAPSSVPGQFACWTTMSLGLASLSWFIWERPINRLKRYFAHDSTVATGGGLPATPAKLLIQ